MKIGEREKRILEVILLCMPTITVGEAERRLSHIMKVKGWRKC